MSISLQQGFIASLNVINFSMKRKIALIGPSTLMVSLPSKWAKKFNLKKGDEIEVTESDKSLVISTENDFSKKELEINVSSLDTMLYRLVGAVYKSGYEQVKIVFNTPNQLETIYDVLRKTCIGFEIIEQSKSYLIIKEISKPEHHEFENVLRRNFLFLLSVAKDSLESAKKQEFQELKNITLRDHNINKYSDFCRRILNKRNVYEFSKNAPLYCVIEQLEKIGDIYRDLCLHIFENEIKLDKSTLEIFEKVNGFLSDFYDLFYKFSFENLETFGTKRKDIKLLLDKRIEKDHHIRYLLNNIFSTTFDLNGALITYKL